MRLDPELPAGGDPYGGVPSVVYNPPRRPPRPPVEITAWTKARWWAYGVVTFLIGMASNAANATPPADTSAHTGSYAESYARGAAAGEIVGGGIGALLFTYLLASLFLAWSRRTRRFIPGTAFGLALVTSAGAAGVRPAGETEAQFASLQRWSDSLGTEHFAKDDAPPRSTDGRMAWASRMAMLDMVEHAKARQRAHGFHPDTFPAAWGTAEYLANARKHPEVREYLTRQQAFYQEMDSTEMPVLRDRMEFRLLQSGLRGRVVEDVLAGMRASEDSVWTETRRQSLANLVLVSARLDMHNFLEQMDARVHLDREKGIARFDRQRDHNLFITLSDRHDRRAEKVERQRLAGRGRLRHVRGLYDHPGQTARTRDRP
ncbi:MAG TPA: hypothetical protein VE871_19310 [Longimicrobium sp.]|nr:hypothetical protein [Longimicrobium sp.]